ncbi:MAG: TetR/AcrR family transcriptional regulator [Pseudomonadota bacterium]
MVRLSTTEQTDNSVRRYKPNETRAKILSAARELFRTKGYSNSSSLEIAQSAGVAEGSLFYHFGSKANLLAALGEEYARDKVEAMHRGETDLSRLEPGIIIARTFAHVREHGFMMAATGLEATSTELQPFMHANRRVVVEFITRCMMAGCPPGHTEPLDEEATTIKASLSYAVVVDALYRVYEAEEADDEARVMAVTIQFVRDACGYGHLTDIPSIASVASKPADTGLTRIEP